MDLNRVDMSLICRTCQNVSSSMRPIFDTLNTGNISDRNLRIDEVVMACAAVQISFGDGLPSLICDICMQRLMNAFNFKKQCEAVDVNLRAYHKNMGAYTIRQELQSSEFIEPLNSLSKLCDNEAQLTKEASPESHSSHLDNNQILLTCTKCTKTFTTMKGLRIHKSSHKGALFKCKQCNKEYTRKNHLERHQALHCKRKVHVCKICNKTLTKVEHLKKHLVIHLIKKPFKCMTCNRTFNQVDDLNNHISRCKGENVHCCPVCNEAFDRIDSLEIHKQQHDSTQLLLPTIENLDNIEQHYFEVYYDANLTFSDNSDLEDSSESQVNITGSFDEGKLDFTNDAVPETEKMTPTHNDLVETIYLNMSQDLEENEHDEKTMTELKDLTKSEVKIEYRVQNEVNNSDSHLAKKSIQTPPNRKRRGRPPGTTTKENL